MTLTSYGPRSIKRKRRTKAEMDRLEESLYELAEQHQPLTVRQLFYRAVAAHIIEKTQAEYNNVVVRLTGKMREAGTLPFSWLVDNTRWMRKPRTHESLNDMLRESTRLYRRDLWADQHVYVEGWCESDSISGVLYPVTDEWDVPLMPCGGQPSKSFVYGAANAMRYEWREVYVYYFGDYDKSGLDISDRVERDLRRYLADSGVDLHFERVAINESQIEQYDLPTCPPKKRNAKKNAVSQTVELEAMTTEDLQAIYSACIERHVDGEALERTRTIEDAERDTLQRIVTTLEAGS